MHSIDSTAQQGCVLGPTLYVLYTSYLPTSDLTTVATFADNTAVLAKHEDRLQPSKYLQGFLDVLQVSEPKLAHVTFTLRHYDCLVYTLMEN